MNGKWKILAGFVLAILLMTLLCLTSYKGGVRHGIKQASGVPLDTTIASTIERIRDTVRYTHPVPVTFKTIDLMFIPDIDTIRLHDTIYTVLPVEQKIYEDSLFRAVVSGFHPSLDEITIFKNTDVITNTVTVRVPTKVKPKNELFLDASLFGVNGAYIPVTAGYVRHWDSGLYLGAGGGYELMGRTPVFQLKGGYSLRF